MGMGGFLLFKAHAPISPLLSSEEPDDLTKALIHVRGEEEGRGREEGGGHKTTIIIVNTYLLSKVLQIPSSSKGVIPRTSHRILLPRSGLC